MSVLDIEVSSGGCQSGNRLELGLAALLNSEADGNSHFPPGYQEKSIRMRTEKQGRGGG